MSKKQSPKITKTKNYGLFHLARNRPVDISRPRRKKLRQSMQQYGYIDAYPVLCVRENRQLFVYDGQHRLAIAKELGLPVAYTVIDDAIDIPFINNTQQTWALNDYAQVYADAGKKDYRELLAFVAQHEIPLSTAIAILGRRSSAAGGNAHGPAMNVFRQGEFTITGRKMADRVARLYAEFRQLSKAMSTRFFIAAIFAVCQVDGIDDHRLVKGARRCPENLVKYGSRDAYLTMLEHVYNFGRSRKEPIKIAAENAMRERNPIKRAAAS